MRFDTLWADQRRMTIVSGRHTADVIDSRAKRRLRTHNLPFARLDKREAVPEVRRDMQG
jgi:hypothetical protein